MIKKRFCVKNRIDIIYELPIINIDGSEDTDLMPGWLLFNNWIFNFLRNPHPAPCAILLEMAFISTPNFISVALNFLNQFF